MSKLLPKAKLSKEASSRTSFRWALSRKRRSLQTKSKAGYNSNYGRVLSKSCNECKCPSNSKTTTSQEGFPKANDWEATWARSLREVEDGGDKSFQFCV